MLPPGDTEKVPINSELGLTPGHFGLLKPVDQQTTVRNHMAGAADLLIIEVEDCSLIQAGDRRAVSLYLHDQFYYNKKSNNMADKGMVAGASDTTGPASPER